MVNSISGRQPHPIAYREHPLVLVIARWQSSGGAAGAARGSEAGAGDGASSSCSRSSPRSVDEYLIIIFFGFPASSGKIRKCKGRQTGGVSPWLLKERGGGLSGLVWRCAGDTETCSGGPGQGGERNQAEQTPKVQVLNAATSGRLGSWVFLGQASARLEDWKELKPQTLLPFEGSGAFWVLQGHPDASKIICPWRDDGREASQRRNNLQEDSSKPPWNTRCSSLAVTTQRGLKERRLCLPQHITCHLSTPRCSPSPALFSASSSKTRLSPTAPTQSPAVASSFLSHPSPKCSQRREVDEALATLERRREDCERAKSFL